MKKFIWTVIFMTAANAANAEIQTREISYESGGVQLTGYLAWDDAIEGERPGMLVVHEWWGHNDYPRMRARMLAAMGYTALARIPRRKHGSGSRAVQCCPRTAQGP